MPIDRTTFYARHQDDDDDISEKRWQAPSKFVSDIVVPPSTAPSEEPLSAPSEGFSAPNGSVTTSPAKSLHRTIQKTRFAHFISRTKVIGGVKVSPAWQQFKPPMKQTVIELPESNSQSKCVAWIQQGIPGMIKCF